MRASTTQVYANQTIERSSNEWMTGFGYLLRKPSSVVMQDFIPFVAVGNLRNQLNRCR